MEVVLGMAQILSEALGRSRGLGEPMGCAAVLRASKTVQAAIQGPFGKKASQNHEPKS